MSPSSASAVRMEKFAKHRLAVGLVPRQGLRPLTRCLGEEASKMQNLGMAMQWQSRDILGLLLWLQNCHWGFQMGRSLGTGGRGVVQGGMLEAMTRDAGTWLACLPAHGHGVGEGERRQECKAKKVFGEY